MTSHASVRIRIYFRNHLSEVSSCLHPCIDVAIGDGCVAASALPNCCCCIAVAMSMMMHCCCCINRSCCVNRCCRILVAPSASLCWHLCSASLLNIAALCHCCGDVDAATCCFDIFALTLQLGVIVVDVAVSTLLCRCSHIDCRHWLP